MAKKFGIEIEFEGNKTAVYEAIRDTGIRVVARFDTHSGSSNRSWTVKRDGSVPRGGELVSPPMDFNNPRWRTELQTICEAMRRVGAQPSAEAGIHVHVEAVHENGDNMTGREIASVVRFTYKFEDAIYRIASSGWDTIRSGARTYAKPIPEETAQLLMKAQTRQEVDAIWFEGSSTWGGAPTLSNRRIARHPLARVVSAQERYCATNLHALTAHNTIEFRYFNSSLNHKRIEGYVALCMAIVDDARNGFSRSVKLSYPIGSMARGEVTEQKLFLRLQQIFRSNGKDTKICMSEADWKNLRASCWKKSKAQNPSWWSHRQSTRLASAARARRLAEERAIRVGAAVRRREERTFVAGTRITSGDSVQDLRDGVVGHGGYSIDQTTFPIIGVALEDATPGDYVTVRVTSLVEEPV